VLRRETVELDDRGVADGVENAVVDHGNAPAG
jgi:hypothetical protein